MKSVSKLRIAIIAIVTLLSIYKTVPTLRYYMFLRHKPAIQGVRQSPDVAEPPATPAPLHEAWVKRNGDYLKWAAQNKDYLTWENEAEKLRLDAIPLGLDLIGGVDVTLKLDREQAIKNTTNSTRDTIERDLQTAKIGAKLDPLPDGSGFTLKLANPADVRQALSIVNRAGLDHAVTEAELNQSTPATLRIDQKQLISRFDGDMNGALKGVRDRVDKLGVTQPRVARQGNDEIRVQVPGARDPDHLIKTVIQPAQLEFRLVSEREAEVIGADGKARPGVTIPRGTEIVKEVDGTFNNSTQQMDFTERERLLLTKVSMTGSDIVNAGVFVDYSNFRNPIQVQLEFNKRGTEQFGTLTAENVHRNLAILLDGTVRSAPELKGPIPDGRAMIEGGFTNETANELAQVLKAGSLPAPLKIESKRVVGATVGDDSIRASVHALALGSIVISLFMIIYYGTAGAIAVVALILNIMMVLAIMALSHATLTLSGIGGMLLTVGMAVDSNVLIYERIREELAAGRSLRQAISLGYHRAFSVIFDSHLTVLITALVLLQFTEGSVKGFALAMTFGLLANLYTGLTVTFALCSMWFEKFGHLTLGRLHIFKHTNIDFIKMRFFSWTLSTGVLLAALIAVLALPPHGLKMGVDFKGGIRAEVQFKQAETLHEDKIRQALADKGLKDANVQAVLGQKNYFLVEVGHAAGAASAAQGESQATEGMMSKALADSFGADNLEIKSTTVFGAETAQGFSQLALLVVILASVAILIYLWFRFELVFGAAAVLALLHDLLIVLLIANLMGVSISLDVVAAFMVLMGFSTNDTIVIFDRIRENTRALHGKTFGDICNLAMNQSLSRTIITSGTVFMAALVLLLLGGEGLRAFAKVYVIGSIVGTYSSDFVAAPLVYQWNKYRGGALQASLSAPKNKIEAAKPIRSGAAAPIGTRRAS